MTRGTPRHSSSNRRETRPEPRPTGAGPRRERRVRLPAGGAEPAMIRGVVVAVLSVLAAFGLDVTVDVDAAVYVIGLVAPIVVALWTRFVVTPNAKVVSRVSVSGDTVVAGEAAAVPTGEPLPLSPTNVYGARGAEVEPVPVDPAVLS